MISAPSFPVTIYIAGDCAHARRIAREFCMNEGACVTVTATSYIYTGGEEAGLLWALSITLAFRQNQMTLWPRPSAWRMN